MRSTDPDLPRYPSITLAVLGVLVLRLFGLRRSFRRDSQSIIARLRPPVRYLGLEHIPACGPYQLHANHYARPGFGTQWIALALSAVQPAEVAWVMADQWVWEGHPLRFVLVPGMRFIRSSFRRVYGFLPMPTMVPGYSDMPRRSAAVRRILRTVREHPAGILGLTPEGWDSPPGGVGLPPPGAGRFILQLNRMGLPILPAAVTELDGCLTVRFGPPYDLVAPTSLGGVSPDAERSRAFVDETIRAIVRDRLLELLACSVLEHFIPPIENPCPIPYNGIDHCCHPTEHRWEKKPAESIQNIFFFWEETCIALLSSTVFASSSTGPCFYP